MTTPHADLQNLNQTSGLIELFILDTTVLDGPIYRFTNTPGTGGTVSFGGNTYICLPIKTEGWDLSANGAPPRPTLTVSNVSKTLLADVIALGDLVGAKLTRIQTYAKYLDGGSSPDSTKFIGPEIYTVEQKTGHNNTAIQWQMSSLIDRLGMKLPRRQVLKDKGFPGVARTRVTG